MKKLLASIFMVGIVSAYASMVLQFTNGPRNIIRTGREKFMEKTANKDASHRTDGTFAELAYCPWCLAPYITLPIWGLVSRVSGVRGWRNWLLGYASSTSLSAFIRVRGEQY